MSILEDVCTLSSMEILQQIKTCQRKEDNLWVDYRNAILREIKEKDNG